MKNNIVRTAEVVARTGLSRTTLWRQVRAGSFPAPIKLTEGGAVGWFETQVEDWLASRPIVNYAPADAVAEDALATA